MNTHNYLLLSLIIIFCILPASAIYERQVPNPLDHTSISVLGPSADLAFNESRGNFPLTIQFMDKSSGERDYWFWRFGDGSFSVEQNPVHTYTKAGTYTPELLISGPNGRSSVRSPFSITVINPLFALIPFQTTAAVNLSNTSDNPTKNLTISGTPSRPTIYVATGTPTKVPVGIILKTERPVAIMTASPVSGDIPLTVHFIDRSTGNPVTWRWDFGDGNSSYSKDPIYTYTKSGSYTPSLKVSNSAGSDEASGFIVIQAGIKQDVQTIIPTTKPSAIKGLPNQPSMQISSIDPFGLFPPFAKFTASPLQGTAPLSVKFIDQSLGSPYIWKWDYGDGETEYKMNPVHVYKEPGVYLPKVIVRNKWGENSAQSTQPITVLAPVS